MFNLVDSFRNRLSPYFFLRFLYSQNQDHQWLILTQRESQAQDFARETEALASILSIAAPAMEFLPDSYPAERNRVLEILAYGRIKALAASMESALAPCHQRQFWESLNPQRPPMVEVSQIIDRSQILSQLSALGYQRTDVVESIGEYAARGQVLDCFSPALREPVRLLFNNDRIESVRVFDPATQTSADFVERVSLLPMRSGSGGVLGDYFNRSLMVTGDQEFFNEGTPDWLKAARLTIAGGSSGRFFNLTPNVSFAGNLKIFWKQAVASWEAGYEILFAAPTLGDEERAREVLTESAQKEHLSWGPVRWVTAPVGQGFKDDRHRLWLVNTQELFSKVPVRVGLPAIIRNRKGPGPGTRAFQASLLELKLADYVVHEIYGIARYRGLERVMDMEGRPHGEFIKLEFAKKDRLFVNPDQMHLIHRYATIASNYAPRLSYLDQRRFSEIKERVREEARRFAQDLLRLWAKRQALPAEKIGALPQWESEFAQSFPYEETEDQKHAIEEIFGDLEKDKPMERLLHGDVGFGKTEVALRAIFRTIMQGRQAVLVAPTTILADQHFRNFSSRLSSYPVSVGLCSRFTPRSEMAAHLKALKAGTLDVVVGTHRLLSRDVHFKNLGLLVIDEEHRFGVAHKERLKMFSSQVHTLYMSATPIPRTLAGSLSGLKEISTIESPPVGRIPIESSVLPWDWTAVTRAIQYELGRGGQVFYVANEIRRLPEAARELEAAAQGLRAEICHGQMTAVSIERVMQRFLEKEIDVLVASSIIESGLDIPTVNTLIVEEAQNFGLAQLYQLRGRIGRNNIKAYAYFFYPKNIRLQDLGAAARERLSAIEEFCELGSGMRLALRDLEIRGAGEIIGKKQHGFVSRVGLEMYSKLLRQEIDRIRGQGSGAGGRQEGLGDDGAWPVVHLNFPAYFPGSLLSSEMERVSYYRRLSRCATAADIAQIFDELRDRCGDLPQEALNLKTLFELRLASRNAGVAALDELDDSWLRFELAPGRQPGGANIVWLLKEFGPRIRFEHAKEAFRVQFSTDPPAANQALNVLKELGSPEKN
ncbi:MAG: DEAD/DEAH box helicase [Elusimicrobia bacterium]|nr:DEAD/DEAH box helicase [Elusimicrobiota bacterium]